VTRLRDAQPRDHGSIPHRNQAILHFTRNVQPGSGTHPAQLKGITGSSPTINQPVYEADNSLSSSAEFKYVCSHTSTPPYAFKECTETIPLPYSLGCIKTLLNRLFLSDII
jgi:hypothetical protein